MKRFVESRDKLKKDNHRPYYHFYSPECQMNDPNGLCFWNGKWHLFYQAYPPEDSRQHWGHAISDDMVYWEDLPYAIYPDPESCCFSGSALAEDDRVIAMYHGLHLGNMVAISSDDQLLNWEKLTGTAVIPNEGADFSHFDQPIFDPCIWKEGEYYYSLSAGALPHETTNLRKRADFLHRSKELKTWEYVHEFVEGDDFTLLGDDGACPYFWPFGDRHILMFFSHMSGGQALIGDYDKERNKFVVTSHHRMTFGGNAPGSIIAPSAVPDGDGGLYAFHNIAPGMYILGEEQFQVMTLPRQYSLNGRDELNIKPIDDLKKLRHNHTHFEDIEVKANKEMFIEELDGNAMEIDMVIDTKKADSFEVNVLCSPDKSEYTKIVFYPKRGMRYQYDDARDEHGKKVHFYKPYSILTLDNTHSSNMENVYSRPPQNAPVFIEDGEKLNLRIFVDKSVVEVFVNEKVCVSQRVYPGKDSTKVSVFSHTQDSVIESIDAYDMKCIY